MLQRHLAQVLSSAQPEPPKVPHAKGHLQMVLRHLAEEGTLPLRVAQHAPKAEHALGKAVLQAEEAARPAGTDEGATGGGTKRKRRRTGATAAGSAADELIPTWREDQQRSDVKKGRFSKAERETIKQAIMVRAAAQKAVHAGCMVFAQGGNDKPPWAAAPASGTEIRQEMCSAAADSTQLQVLTHLAAVALQEEAGVSQCSVVQGGASQRLLPSTGALEQSLPSLGALTRSAAVGS